MWILFIKTYAGPLGLFEAGSKKDLPESTLCKLPKECYKKICPPWEEKKDKDSCELDRLIKELNITRQAIEQYSKSSIDYRNQAETLLADAESCLKIAKEAEAQIPDIEAKIKNLTEKIEAKKKKVAGKKKAAGKKKPAKKKADDKKTKKEKTEG